jgi:hypothetical protein
MLTPAPMAPDELGAAAFQADMCTTLLEVEQAIGNAAGARGREAEALFDALEARDPDAILAAVGPVRNHVDVAAEIVANSIPWPPGEETRSLLESLLRHLATTLEDIERDAQAGIAPDAGAAAFVDAETGRQFQRILEASQEAFAQAPPEWAGC